MKKYKLLLLILFFSIYTSAQNNFNNRQKQAYNTIVAIGKAWANNDLKVLEDLIAADYFHTDVWGNVLTRKEWISYVQTKKKEGIINPVMEFEDVQIRLSGNNAFVTGTNIVAGQLAKGDQKEQQQKIKFTQILSKENGKWKRKLFQGTFLQLQPDSNLMLTKNHLEQLSKEWMDAMLNHDSTKLYKLMAPEYALHSWDGNASNTTPRATWMYNLFNHIKIDRWHQTAIVAQVYGNVAIVNSLYSWSGSLSRE